MPIQIWRLVSIFFTAFVFGLSFREHGDLGEFALWTGALVGVVCIANWFVSKSAKLADRIYNAGLPVLYLAGYFGALAAVSAPAAKIVVAALGSSVFYLIELFLLEPHPRAVREIAVLSTAFLLQVTLWATSFFFVQPWWVLMSAVFFVSTGLYFLVFFSGGLPHRRAFLWALVCAFIQVEAAWAVFFWPVHFLTAAVVNFSFFYGIFVVTAMYFEGPINRRSLYFQMGLILIVLVVSLLSSPWSPIE